MVLIANPLYDVVFKYLLEDKESAIILLSTLLEEEIVELEPRPYQQLLELESRFLTVYREDFSAKIKTGTGEYELVILEIQKAKLASDIMRFRRCMGKQYTHKENVYTTESGEVRTLPVVSIYFLDFGLPGLDTPVIHVKRSDVDTRMQAQIPATATFIESLTNDAYIVQVAKLEDPYGSEAERLLRIFDQNNQNKADGGRSIRVDEARYPVKFMRLKDRLAQAMADEALQDQMDIEEDILEELKRLERKVDQKEKALEEKNQALEQKGKALEQKGKALEQKGKALEERDQLVAQQRKELEERDKTLRENNQRLDDLARALSEQARVIEELRQALFNPAST